MSIAQKRILLNGGSILLLALFLYLAEQHLDGYQLQIINLIAINSILAVSLNLIYGFTGMFSLGHAGFMAIGAYTSALLILAPEQKEMLWILEEIIWPASVMQAPFFVSVVAGGLIAALCACFIAIPVLRLGGDYLGIATLGFAEIIRIIITNFTPFTNGALGLKGIPSYANIWWNYTWLVLTLYFIIRILNSNFGNVLKSIRDDEIAAKVMGMNIFKYKLLAFCMGAFFAGVGGALMGSLITTIDPRMFNFLLTFNILMIVVAGGLGSITGSIVGSVIITVMLEWLRFVEEPMFFGFFEIPGIPGMRMVVFSLALLFIILFRRKGLLGMREFSWDFILKKNNNADSLKNSDSLKKQEG